MLEREHLAEWFKLTNEAKISIFNETGRNIGLPALIIEKDWWVVHTLSAVFSMSCADSLVFKGGTSLSKGWRIIERFSEDIDISLNRDFLGFSGELSNTKIGKLREASSKFISGDFTRELQAKFKEAGFTEIEIKCAEVKEKNRDPRVVEIIYPSLTEKSDYVSPKIQLEIGSRSLREPFTERQINTFVSEQYKKELFADELIGVPMVNPERTFLEKIFLLHEEFQKSEDTIRVNRLSRHLYDIEKILNTEYAQKAMKNKVLYDDIRTHREKFNAIKGIDYSKHSPENIKFIPPDKLLPLWEKDYRQMQENMIYGSSLPFSVLIESLKELQNRINAL